VTFQPSTTPPPFIGALIAGDGANFVVTSGTSWAFSTDGGDTWTLPSGSVPAFTPNYLAGVGGTVFVAADAGGNWARSADGGNTWSPMATEPTILE
jgi:hypothetical protein